MQDFTGWKPPSGAQVLAAPGFAKQWDFNSSASISGGGGDQPNLANMLNWSQIPGVPANAFTGQSNAGDSDTGVNADNDKLDQWLGQNGYKIMDSGQVQGTVGYRWIQDGNGNVVGEPSAYDGEDGTFLKGAALAAAIAGAGVFAAQSVGAGAATSGATSAGVAPGVSGSTPFSLGGAASGAGGAGNLTPAALESLIGTPGYGFNAAAQGALNTAGSSAIAGAGAYLPESALTSGNWSSATDALSNYGNEGRNYPTPESTQGPSGSPVNSGPTSSSVPSSTPNAPPGAPPNSDPLSTGSAIGDRLLGTGAGALVGAGVNALAPRPPAVPNPADTIAAQTAANSAAAQETTALGRPNVTNPFGSSTWTRVADPSMPGGFRWENNVAFSPEQQGLYNTTVGNQQSLLDTSTGLLSKIDENYRNPFDLSAYGQAQTVNSDPNNFNSQRDQVQQALYDRLTRTRNPAMERDRAQMDSTLRNQGLTPGSEAYDSAMKNLLEAQSGEMQDYTSRSVEAGGMEQSRLNTDFRSNTGFNNTVRQNNITEGLDSRNRPLTEYNALTNGTQPTLPTFQPYGTGSVSPTNVGGIQQQGYSNAQDTYNARMAQYQNILNFGAKIGG